VNPESGCGNLPGEWLRVPSAFAGALRNTQRSRAQLLDYQSRALRRLVVHAAGSVPFYQEHFSRAGVSPETIRSAADLTALPPVTKDALRERPVADRLAGSVDPDQLVSISTTGSTGRPFRIYNTWLELRLLHLFRLRAHWQFGRRPGDRLAEIDQPVTRHPNDRKHVGALLRALRLEGRIQLSLFDPPSALLDSLEEFRPHIVTAYPSVLLRLGRELRQRPRRPQPRFLLTNSEVLTAGARAELSTLWNAPVYQFYDCHECNLIAWDCPAGHGLHCNEDVAVIEVLRDGRPVAPGERGEVTITSLYSYAMPLLRFQLGDVATRGPAPCPCGAPFATLKAVEGRMVDFFRLPDGSWLHPFRLIMDLDGDGGEWVRQYQLVQERQDRIVFSAVPAAGATPERLERFRRNALAAVGHGVEVVARFVDAIEPGPGGKFRPARSLLHSEYGPVDWTRVDEPVGADTRR
jgi:phenylacetate-CoA ligase